MQPIPRARLALRLVAAACAVLAPPGAAAQSVAPGPTRLDTVVVTANPLGSELLDMVVPVSVVSGERLLRAQQPTLGEITGALPGISSSYFGPNASRPVIRGLDGERVRVLQNGIGVFDASSTSPDHAVALDPLTVRRIEAVRGPATLLYGPSAIGGVVNVIDNRIPSDGTDGVRGAVDLRYASPARERAVGATLDAGGSTGWQVHADGFWRRTDDLRIPDYAYSRQLRATLPDDEQGPRYRLPNSASESYGGAAGLSWVGERGFGGVSYHVFDTDYGTVAEPDVTIRMKQERITAAGELRDPFASVKSIRVRYGHADYRHTEFEGDEVGTVFRNRGYEARVDATHARIGPFEGAVGIQVVDFDFSAQGEEAFLPDTTTRQASGFFYEEYAGGPLRLQLGARYDRTKVAAADSGQFGPGQSRTFDTGGGSVGAVWTFAEGVAAVGSYAYSQRPPNYQELYADGPHVATGIFEIGDRDLDIEVSSGIDVALRRTGTDWSGRIGAFWNRFHNYIALFPTGTVEDDLPVWVYRQTRAQFYGIELEGRATLGRAAGGDFDVEVMADWLRGTNLDTGAPLPRITPLRFGGALVHAHERWEARVDVLRVQAQDRTAPEELATDGYTMLGVSFTLRIGDGARGLTAFVQGVNLLNEDARTHASPINDIAPLGGRGVVVGMRGAF
jgi:iron complex outermembrane receptor protein